mmetsp:Transcript_7023/g.14248  ORF Transcript_7023/g.14248 Transcript_7023/m.14248 type:complete len:320 (+) Transcript_7023:385-1344(+)
MALIYVVLEPKLHFLYILPVLHTIGSLEPIHYCKGLGDTHHQCPIVGAGVAEVLVSDCVPPICLPPLGEARPVIDGSVWILRSTSSTTLRRNLHAHPFEHIPCLQLLLLEFQRHEFPLSLGVSQLLREIDVIFRSPKYCAIHRFIRVGVGVGIGANLQVQVRPQLCSPLSLLWSLPDLNLPFFLLSLYLLDSRLHNFERVLASIFLHPPLPLLLLIPLLRLFYNLLLKLLGLQVLCILVKGVSFHLLLLPFVSPLINSHDVRHPLRPTDSSTRNFRFYDVGLVSRGKLLLRHIALFCHLPTPILLLHLVSQRHRRHRLN